MLAVPVAVILVEPVDEMLRDTLADDVPLGVTVVVDRGLYEGESCVETVIVGELVSDDDAVTVAATLRVGETELLPVIDGEGELEPVSDIDGVGCTLCVLDGETEDVAATDALSLEEADADAV